MAGRISGLPVSVVEVDAGAGAGALEMWRHSFGHGGVNSLPLPEKVQRGIAGLKPRLVRIFIQEFFRIYPGHGRFDWSRLDPYMEAMAGTGAKVVAAICVKPRALFPVADEKVWRPSDVAEWQQVVAGLARRSSVERPIVTHWEIGNEVDIGEQGGCPYLIKDPREYFEYYRMTIEAVLRAFPGAKVGGPANASVKNEPLAGFVRLCRESGTRLDFISHHLYHDDPKRHAECVREAQKLVADWRGRKPEVMVTEFSPGFKRASTEEQAFEPRRAGCVAAAVMEMMEAGLDWSFHYHMWDQTCFEEDFSGVFSGAGTANMMRHWNEIPHRFGLFGVGGEVRPQYFVYRILGRLGEERLKASSRDADVRVLAGRTGGRLSAMVVNYSVEDGADRVVTVRWVNAPRGTKRLTCRRIDEGRRWSETSLELEAVESRMVDTVDRFEHQILLPAGCVAEVVLE